MISWDSFSPSKKKKLMKKWGKFRDKGVGVGWEREQRSRESWWEKDGGIGKGRQCLWYLCRDGNRRIILKRGSQTANFPGKWRRREGEVSGVSVCGVRVVCKEGKFENRITRVLDTTQRHEIFDPLGCFVDSDYDANLYGESRLTNEILTRGG